MDHKRYRNYLAILKEELIPALGCTEPIALAYAAAKAKEIFEHVPERMEVWCSGNIIKNVKSVTVPNSGGMRGIEAAAVLGMTGGNASRGLEVLEGVDAAAKERAKWLLKEGFCSCFLQEGVENLYILVKIMGQGHESAVEIADRHTRIVRIERDGRQIYRIQEETAKEQEADRSLLNVRDILSFAETADFEDIRDVIGRQVRMNGAIAEEGLAHAYGAQVGRTLLEVYGDNVKVRAKARAAAGSDARMNGCPLPVVINSGSGNQGMACCLPVMEFARYLEAGEERMYRALVVSNLTAIHQKKYIGSLSAYCGAVSAACGAGAGITWLYGGDYEAVSRTITNTIANVGGIVCDGAKSSCAAKIASAVDAAVMAHFLGERSRCFEPGEGLVGENVEKTIRNVGYVGKAGMRDTDVTILNLMIARDGSSV